MRIIAIYRQAKLNQKSSLSHLLVVNEITNQDAELNPNHAEKDILITINNDNQQPEFIEYSRNLGHDNSHLVKLIEDKEIELYSEAQADYENHKKLEKLANPTKKIRTKLQPKIDTLRKEFIIGFGNQFGNLNRSELLAHFNNDKQQLTKSLIDGAIACLEHKQLSAKNILGITIHFSEKGLPHAHIVYQDYSFSQHTTGNQLDKKIDQSADKKTAYKNKIQHFAKYQDILADTMNLSRGQRNSRTKNQSIREFEKTMEIEKKNENLAQIKLNEQIALSQIEIFKQQQNQKLKVIDNEITEKQSQLDNLSDKINIAKYLAKAPFELNAISKAFDNLHSIYGIERNELIYNFKSGYNQNALISFDDVIKETKEKQQELDQQKLSDGKLNKLINSLTINQRIRK